MRAKSLQSCPTLCDPMDCSPPGSSVHGILQARILEWVTMPSSKGPSHPGIKPTSLSSLSLAGGFFISRATWDPGVKCRGLRWVRWHPTPVLLPGKSQEQRSLLGCSPWGRSESDTTERLPFHLSLSCIGEGNGNPLQCSCLENPRDGGGWWAAVCGVTQSRTRLK